MGITTNGLVLYAPLYSTDLQGSPITSKDVNQHSLTVTGATWGNQGRLLDGIDDFIDAGNSSPLDTLAGAFSVSVWLKPTLLDGNNKGIAMKGEVLAATPPNSFILNQAQLDVGDSKAVIFKIFDDNNNAGIGYGTNNVLVAGSWCNLCGTYNGGTTNAAVKLYINSVLGAIDNDQSNGTFVSMTTSSHNLNFGRSLVGGNYIYNNCLLGEVLLYNRALSASEVTDNYKETVKTYKACYGFATYK